MRIKLTQILKHLVLFAALLAVGGSAWADGTVIYCKKFGHFETNNPPNLYYWNNNCSNSWPGTSMSNTVKGADGNDWYYLELNCTPENIIFNNNGQTGDISLGSDRWFVIDDDRNVVSRTPNDPDLAPDLYVRGIVSWDASDANKMSESDGVYTKVFSLTASTTYTFKIGDSSWGTHNYGKDNTTFSCNTGVVLEDNKGDLSFTPSTSGDHTFTFTLDTKTLEITCPAACTAPTVTTNTTATGVGLQGATVKGTVTDGTCTVTETGIVYGTSAEPTGNEQVISHTSGTQFSKTLSNLSPGTKYYFRAYAKTASGTTYGSDGTFTTTACSAPEITASSLVAATYCKGTGAASVTALSVTANGGVGTITYQWKSSSSASGTYTNVSGATSNTYKPSTATAGTTYYKCIVSSASPCTSSTVTSSASGAILIDATSVAGTISGGSAEQCLGATKTLTLGSYTGTIQWHVGNASDFTPSSSTAISGATNSTYKAPINEVGTKYYKAVVTNGVCPSATTVTAADITVNRKYQASDFNLSGNTQDYDGNPKTVTVAEKSGAGNGAITIKYAGSTTAPTNAGTYAITIDVDKSTTSPYYCPASDLSVGTLTINKANQSTVSITNAGIYCAGSEVTALATGGSGTGSYSFARVSGTSGITINTSTGAITASNAGTITVNATRAGDANYNPSAASSNVTFTFSEGPAKFTLTAAGGTTICSAGGKLRLSGSESGFSYQLYKNGSAYRSPVEGTGSALEFDVFESGDYVCRAYLTSSPSCYTIMTGEVTLHISLTPTLIPATPTVTSYTPVTITSINTDILTWEISGEGNTAYLYDKTSNTVKVKASAAGSPYTITATTAGGCSQTATLTVNADVEVCN